MRISQQTKSVFTTTKAVFGFLQVPPCFHSHRFVLMGDEFFVYDSIANAPHVDKMRDEFQVKRARFDPNVAPPPLGQHMVRGNGWDWGAGGGVPFATVVFQAIVNNNNDRTNTVEILLTALGQMTDQDAAAIFKWAEQLCGATSVERTPWCNQAMRTPQGRWFTADAQLWKATFAQVMVLCNPLSAADRELVVPQCRRAVVCGYVPCSSHMWRHPNTTTEEQREIAKRWGNEALVRRLVAAFQSPDAGNADDRTSFQAVRRLLALYLYVAAITQGVAYPDFRTQADFREDPAGSYDAFFVKDLLR